MKLQFKEQQFQLNAVNAVVDCFTGQPQETNRFTLERSANLIRKAKAAATGTGLLEFEQDVLESIGYRNRLLQITDGQILKNIQAVQQSNEIIESEIIERPKVDKTLENDPYWPI